MVKKYIIERALKSTQDIKPLTTSISDSFVQKNKLRTENNVLKGRPSSGEARLYLGSQSLDVLEDFFPFNTTVSYLNKNYDAYAGNCYFFKNNLLSYIDLAFNEYHNPVQSYFHDISENFFEFKKEIEELPEDKIHFTVFNHKGKEDSTRFYISSTDAIWGLVRKVALPKISTLQITKSTNEHGQLEFYFILNLQEEYCTDEQDLLLKVIEMDKLFQQLESENRNTNAISLITARRGHGTYKNRLLKTMKTCPFTGVSDPLLLHASHIKPWIKSINAERLDGFNGLLLTPTYDSLFDKGLISFTDEGYLLISPHLSKDIKEKLGINENVQYAIANSHGKRSPYLSHHRESIFKK